MIDPQPPIKRLNATLAAPLAQFIAERYALNDLLRRSLAEDSYSPLTAEDVDSIHAAIV
jgi:hypothetical protein